MDAISCLAPPATSFADAALHCSMPFESASFSSSSSATGHNHYSSPLLCADQLAYAPDYSPRRSSPPGGGGRRLAPAGARAGKRRSRASKRAPTTYISTNPSNFRFMVQHITGVQAEPEVSSSSLLLAALDTNPLLMTAPGDHHHHHHQQEQQQPPCFPTLDSWNVSMYERNDLL